MKKMFLIGKNLTELEDLCIKNDCPKFHGTQLYKWIYQKKSINMDEMTNIPDKLKNIISQTYNIDSLSFSNKQTSNVDNTNKFLLKTSDNKFIESVSMIDGSRHTVCISSQIGCSVDCDFCATGKMGIIRNLDIGEILNQLTFISRQINKPITNIVFMGMGEPFLNYKNVIAACKILTDTNAFNFGTKKITLSTSGILPKLEKYILDGEKYKLAISLNASNNKTRDKIIPINKKWPIESLLSIIKKYKHHKYRPIMFEYILLKDINDQDKHAYELIELLKNINCKINIIPYNEISSDYVRSNTDNIINFSNIIKSSKFNLKVFIRWSKGQDIDAGCGQLATKNEN